MPNKKPFQKLTLLSIFDSDRSEDLVALAIALLAAIVIVLTVPTH